MDLTVSNYLSDDRPVEESSNVPTKREVKGARRVRNACLQCRERKIRCSRTYPCRGCVSRGDGDACDWQGGFPSGDIPLQEQRAAEQRRQFEELNDRIFQMKSLMSSHLRRDPTLRSQVLEWTQLHPALENVCHEIMNSDTFATSGCSASASLPDWTFPSLFPPDSATSFDTCTSGATGASTFRSYGIPPSSSSDSPLTAASFISQKEFSLPFRFPKRSNKSGYKSWRDLRQAGSDHGTVQAINPANASRFQTAQQAVLQTLPHLSQFASWPEYYSAQIPCDQSVEEPSDHLDIRKAPRTGTFQSSDHLYSAPSTSNQFSQTIPEQCFMPANCFESIYENRQIFPENVPRTPSEVRLSSQVDDNPHRNVGWICGNQSSGPPPISMPIDVGMLSFGGDMASSGFHSEQVLGDHSHIPLGFSAPTLSWNLAGRDVKPNYNR